MGELYRMQKNTDNENKLLDVASFCIENGVLAMGWSLKNSHLFREDEEPDIEKTERRALIKSFDDYERFINDFCPYKSKSKVNENVQRLYDMKKDDLVWIRNKGVYYLGRVMENSQYNYDASKEMLDADASNQRDNIEWYRVGEEGNVPGGIATSFIRGKTLQRINKEGMLQFSQLKFNELSKRQHYSVALSYGKDTFYSLFSTADCEDLLCLWLYQKYGYICIPSTSKVSTELYECVLINPKNGENVFPQAKDGEVSLEVSDYTHLNGECWLFTTKGRIIGTPTENVKVANPDELFSFVEDPKNRVLLNQTSILKWFDYMKENSK